MPGFHRRVRGVRQAHDGGVQRPPAWHDAARILKQHRVTSTDSRRHPPRRREHLHPDASPLLQVLKPGGCDEAVTNDNRLQFVHLAADWHLGRRLGQPAEAFAEGMHEASRLGNSLQPEQARRLLSVFGAPHVRRGRAATRANFPKAHAVRSALLATGLLTTILATNAPYTPDTPEVDLSSAQRNVSETC